MSATFAQLLLMLLSTTNTGEILNFFNIIVIKFLETRETNNHFSYFSRSVNLFSLIFGKNGARSRGLARNECLRGNRTSDALGEIVYKRRLPYRMNKVSNFVVKYN